MTIVNITDDDVKRGRKVLQAALKEAREKMSETEANPEVGVWPMSKNGASFLPHICIGNLQSLVLREEAEGWFADFVLKTVPNGWPDVFGTPSAQPHSSKEDAFQEGCETLCAMLLIERLPQKPAKPKLRRPFFFGGKAVFSSYR
jgi:hypothetical protein